MTSIRLGPIHPAFRRALVQDLLLGAGALSSLVYVAADILCGLRYPGYSFTNQVISELSAIGAPTAALWGSLLRWYALLFVGFTIGTFQVAGNNPSLRRTGWLMLAFVLSGPLWAFVPMHQRGAEFTWTDAGHIAMGGVTVLLLTITVGVGRGALGPRFRRYSLATMGVVFVTGAATFAYVGPMIRQQPTPGAGLVERVSLYAWLLWVTVLAVSLWRRVGRSGQRLPA